MMPFPNRRPFWIVGDQARDTDYLIDVAKSSLGTYGVSVGVRNVSTVTQSVAAFHLEANNGALHAVFEADGLGGELVADPATFLGNYGSFPLVFFTANTVRLWVGSTGNVSVGQYTFVPDQVLGVNRSEEH